MKKYRVKITEIVDGKKGEVVMDTEYGRIAMLCEDCAGEVITEALINENIARLGYKVYKGKKFREAAKYAVAFNEFKESLGDIEEKLANRIQKGE